MNEKQIEKTVYNTIDLAIELDLYKKGLEQAENYQETLRRRIRYLDRLLEKSKEELDEIDYMEEAEKYI